MSIYSNGHRVAYGIKHYDLDSIEDLKSINKSNLTPGSTIFIIDSSKYYKLNNKKQWIEIYPYGKNNIPGGGSDDDPDFDNPIYDGGSIDNSDPV
jgi:hypothetical protein